MKQGTVYLAGLISTDHPASLVWRTIAEPMLEARDFRVLSPLRGKANLSQVSPDGGVSHPDLSPKDIVLRDYNDIVNSDVILMHLETFGSTRPLLGTVAEMAWAWKLRIPIVAVANLSNYLMRSHPFVREFVAHYFETVEEAVDFIANHHRRC
jgi:nucleoside 2-deoxyribosyltransferase